MLTSILLFLLLAFGLIISKVQEVASKDGIPDGKYKMAVTFAVISSLDVLASLVYSVILKSWWHLLGTLFIGGFLYAFLLNFLGWKSAIVSIVLSLPLLAYLTYLVINHYQH